MYFIVKAFRGTPWCVSFCRLFVSGIGTITISFSLVLQVLISAATKGLSPTKIDMVSNFLLRT